MIQLHARPRNHLLLSLSDADFALLQPHLEPVAMPLRLKLEIPHKPIAHIYFPESGIVSVVAMTSAREQIEAGFFGWDGMSGVTVVMGDDRAPHATYVQLAGHGQRIALRPFREAMRKSSSMQLCFLHFAQALMIQGAHTALANGRAKVEERLARWILMAHDRVAADDLAFTHEFLAIMLGVRRAGVSVALHELESRALIGTARGRIVVRDRPGLEKTANGYYGLPEAEYTRLTGWHAREKAKKPVARPKI
ncbi:MAG TPA: Crp/Fnr family transcriptional regulator [Rhizomicrobium sp.]